jgi:hypothetical protein
MPGRATNDPANYIAIGKQAAKGTEATTFYFLKHLDGSGFDLDPDTQTERVGGDGQEVGFSYRSLVKADGALVSYAWPEWTGRALSGVLGQDTITATAAGPINDHTLVPVASLPYHTIEQKWADEKERLVDVKITGVDIEFEAGRPIKVSAQFVGGGTVYEQVAADLSPVREAGKPHFLPLASVVITPNASGAKMTKGKMSVKRGVDDGIQTIGITREDVVELNQDVTFDCTLKYEDRTLYKQALYGGGTTVPVDLATISVDIFQTRGSQSMRFVQPLLEVTGAKVNRLDPDGKTMYVDVAAQSVRNATYPFFAVIRSTATAPF